MAAQAAANLEVKRELARRNLIRFVEHFNSRYKSGWVHYEICRALEQFSQDVVDEKNPRLILTVPPRHGKSEIASRRFAAWHLGHNPHHEFIQCSYSGALAFSFSRATRQVMRDPEYEHLFPNARLSPDTQSVENWLTTEGGGFLAAGVGGPITGRGAHCLVIDDPVKNQEEADSETSRETVWEWYQTTAYTRLAPGGGVLVIQTRWHFDDLSGRLIDEQKRGGDVFKVINFPALAVEDEPFRNAGDALHPERYDVSALKRIQRTLGPRPWSALYQQEPMSEDGAYFSKETIRMYRDDERPSLDELNLYAAFDPAIGLKEMNDFTAGFLGGIDENGVLWIIDRVKKRMDAHDIAHQLCDWHEQYQPSAMGVEDGMILQTLGPLIDQVCRERGIVGFGADLIEPLKVRKQDKVARARTLQGFIRQGLVRFPQNAPWMTGTLNEMLQFPFGKHDDQVDALAWLALMVEDMVKFKVLAPKKTKKKSWKDRLDQYVSGGNSKHWMKA